MSQTKYIKPVLMRVKDSFSKDNISGYAQMVAYNILFATAPLLMVLVASASAIARVVNKDMRNPAEPVLSWMTSNLPSEAATFLEKPIQSAIDTSPGFILSFGAIFALWGARGAMGALIRGLNVAYGVRKDNRGFLKLNGLAIGLTLGFGLFIGIAGILIALGSNLGERIAGDVGLGSIYNAVATWARWPVVLVLAILALAMLHRFGPDTNTQLKWLLPGAAFTIIAGAIASFALTIYFANSGGYTATYGVFGSVLAFVFYLYVMSLIILLGGVINNAIHEMVPKATNEIAAWRREHDDEEQGSRA